MKLLSSYFKEMKIAARGFYFYIEVFMAVIFLIILLVAVNETPESKQREFIYYDMSAELKEYMMQADIENGSLVLGEPTEFKMKALQFEVENKETGEIISYEFDEEIYTLETYKSYNVEEEMLQRTMYVADDEEKMIRLAYQERVIGASIIVNDMGEASYRYYNQGYESERFENVLYVLHTEDAETIKEAFDRQEVTKLGEVTVLNSRENMVPVIIVLMGSLMGFFIVMAYVFLDKDEGVIRAFAVTPSAVWKYLLSKIMVILTTVIISSSIIAIPVMKLQPNYLLFYLLLLISSFAFASLGLLVSSFFDNISKAFGALYVFMIAMMLPSFSYFIPSFDPLWLRFFPTYPLLQGMKETIMVNADVGYVLANCSGFLVGGIVLFLIASLRFKKSLTV